MFICRYIPLRQWAFDDSHSPKYQKFKVDKLPRIIVYEQWDYRDYIPYIKARYGKTITPVHRRKECNIPTDCTCPRCNAPQPYLYRNNGALGQILCKVCQTAFSPNENRFSKTSVLLCPYCSHALQRIKDRKHFVIHKCINPKCSYYLRNLKNVDKDDIDNHVKYKYKLHYIYREFTMDFFRMELDSLPKNASSLKFSKHSAEIMGRCLTMHVNLGLSLRKTSQAMKDLFDVSISHQQVANYCKTAAVCIKPFVDHFDYQPKEVFTADETYIKVRGIKTYVWLIMDAAKRSIIGYQVSDNRGVGPCIMAMRMAFRHLKELPKNFRFIADGYSAYPLAAQQFFRQNGEAFKFDITQVIGLQNNDEVSKEFRPYKQMIERVNRTFKHSYRPTCGYDSLDGASYDLALWVAYYNFLRPHRTMRNKVLNEVETLQNAGTMPNKWQMLIYLGQQTILRLQQQNAEGAICS